MLAIWPFRPGEQNYLYFKYALKVNEWIKPPNKLKDLTIKYPFGEI